MCVCPRIIHIHTFIYVDTGFIAVLSLEDS